MSDRVEGTFTLDGLLEGHVPADQGAEKLTQWVKLLSQVGLTLNLKLDGNHFSIFAESVLTQASTIGADAATELRGLLQQLVDAIGAVGEHELFSTLRSVEFQPGTEVQTVYLIRADGVVDIQQERLVAETTAPAQPQSQKQKVKRVGVGLLVLGVIFALSTLFVDYKALWSRVAPLDGASVEVDNASFDAWITVEKIEVVGGSQTLRLTLTRTAAYPTSDDAQRALAARHPTLPDSLRVHALLTGYVRCEMLDGQGAVASVSQVRTKGLAVKETLTVDVRVPRGVRPAKLVFVP